MFERPVWAEVDLGAIDHNVKQIRRLTGNRTKICAVVKADAYGHGVIAVAKTVLQAGADQIAVAILNEALELRRAGFLVPILVLGYTPECQAAMIVEYNITQTIFSMESARALSEAAAAAGKTVTVHIKIDTGMGRIGIRPEDAGEFAEAVSALPGIEIEGVFSHLADSDNDDKSFANEQYRRFLLGLEAIEAKGIQISIRHIANSAAILDLPHMHLDMVRPGIILYGLWPSNEVDDKIDLRPAMKLKAKVAFIKDMPPQTSVSYGRAYFTKEKSRIVTLPVGYADGWSRLLAHKGQVLIRGQRAPLVGRICMDQCMADVTHIPGVAVGDEVLLFGGPSLPVEEVAEHMGTINYEIICMLDNRVPRLYR